MTSANTRRGGAFSRFLQKLLNSSPASLARAAKRRLRARPQTPVWHTVKSGPAQGAQMLLPPAHEDAFKEMADGTFDNFLHQALEKTRHPKGKICWDIGAHIGYHSICFASLGAEVLAFEPNETNAQILRLHLEKNPAVAGRIRHIHAAVADRDGELEFIQSDDLAHGGSSSSHLDAALPPYPRHLYQNCRHLAIPAVTIDTLISQRGEKPPDILKIDVEGAEALVLRGGSRFFSSTDPVLLIEVHHILLMQEVSALLHGWGYQISVLDTANATPSRCFILAQKPAPKR